MYKRGFQEKSYIDYLWVTEETECAISTTLKEEKNGEENEGKYNSMTLTDSSLLKKSAVFW